MEEPGVESWCRRHVIIAEGDFLLGPGEKALRVERHSALRGPHVAGLPPLRWRVSSMPTGLKETGGQSTQRGRSQVLFLKRTHAGRAAGRAPGTLESWVPEFPAGKAWEGALHPRGP